MSRGVINIVSLRKDRRDKVQSDAFPTFLRFPTVVSPIGRGKGA